MRSVARVSVVAPFEGMLVLLVENVSLLSDVNFKNLFFFVSLTAGTYKLGSLSLAFHPSLIFAGKAGADPNRALLRRSALRLGSQTCLQLLD